MWPKGNKSNPLILYFFELSNPHNCFNCKLVSIYQVEAGVLDHRPSSESRMLLHNSNTRGSDEGLQAKMSVSGWFSIYQLQVTHWLKQLWGHSIQKYNLAINNSWVILNIYSIRIGPLQCPQDASQCLNLGWILLYNCMGIEHTFLTILKKALRRLKPWQRGVLNDRAILQ